MQTLDEFHMGWLAGIRSAHEIACCEAFQREAEGHRMQSAAAAGVAIRINDLIHQFETTPHSLRAPAATVEPREPASLRLLPVRVGWQRLKAGYQRLADSALGDFLATLCFALTAIIVAVFCLAP